MKLNDEFSVNIEKISNLGYGIARIDGFVIFVAGACTGDTVKIKISKINKNYGFATVVDIINSSPYRIKPFCSLHNVCGACQFQFIDYDYQLKVKRQIVQDALYQAGICDIEIQPVIPSPQIKEFRHKIQYPVSQTRVSKRFLAGYYKTSSHEIVNIKHCPIQPAICDEIIEFIRQKAQLAGISGYNEENHSGELRHIIIRISSFNGQCLVVPVVNSEKVSDKLKNLCFEIYKKFDEVCGVCVNFNTQKTNVITGKTTQCICGNDFVEEKILNKVFKIGADTFFQVNPKSAENIFSYVKNYIQNNFDKPYILDAYAGITAFGTVLSDVCEKVVSVEENPKSCRLAKDIINANNINNIEINNRDASEFFKREKRKFDLIILDPPRKGCERKGLDEVIRLCKNKIIYVSCNPSTLARDLKYLREKGCKIESVQPFDMFCHTYHIENAAIISCPLS